MALKDVLVVLEKIGFTDVVLPFIIVFTVVFAVLQKSKVLGADSKGRPKANYNAMVAFVVAFFVLVMTRTLKVISLFTQYVVILLLIFVFLGIIVSFVGGSVYLGNMIKFIGLALLLFVLLQALVMAGVISEDLGYRIILPLLVALFVAGGAIALMSGGKGEKPGKPEKKQVTQKGKKPVAEREFPVEGISEEGIRV